MNENKTKKNHKFFIILLFCLAIIITCFYLISEKYKSSKDVLFYENIIAISPVINGKISSVKVQENENIKQNSLLCEINSQDLKAKLGIELAKLEFEKFKLSSSLKDFNKTKQKFDSAQKDYDRHYSMYNEKIISKRDYENNFNSYKNVKSQYNGEKKVINDISENIKSIETNIFNTKKAIENTKIYSPINGKITKLSIKKGDIVKSGQNIIEISSNEFYIIAKFSNRNIKKFKTEMPVSIKIPSLSKKIFKGHIDRISEDDNTIKIIFDKDYSKYEFQRETPAKVTVKIW